MPVNPPTLDVDVGEHRTFLVRLCAPDGHLIGLATLDATPSAEGVHLVLTGHNPEVDVRTQILVRPL